MARPERIHDSWLAAKERILLTWIAARIPPSIVPDHLTLLGLFGALLGGAGFLGSRITPGFLWLACFGLWVNWLGDSLDGTLARVRRIERPTYGFFVDHASDVIAQALIFLGLGLSPHMLFATACLLLMSYWLAALYTFIRAVAVGVFRISYFGVGPTEIRLGLLLYTLGLIGFGPLTFDTNDGRFSMIDGIAMVIFPLVLTCYGIMTWAESRRLAGLEPPLPQGSREPRIEAAAGLALRDRSAS